MKKIIILLITLFFITGCKFYDEYKMPEEVTINLNDNIFEIYSNKTIKDLIKDTNADIINEDDILKTNKDGIKNTTINYKYNKREYKYDISYTIEDKASPSIIRAPYYRSTYQGEEINLCDITTFIDNYDRNPTCSIDGNYDINEIGTYNLKYVFKDKFDNKSEKEFIFEVLSNYYSYEDDNYYYEDDNDYIDFKDIVSNYKNDDNMIGIDVSSWQSEIDFNEVKNDGCEFVIMRVAVTVGDNGEIEIDNRYKENINKAKKAGLKVGVYLYTDSTKKEEIIAQAKFVKKILNKIKLDFPVAYDFEDFSNINSHHINKHDLLTNVKKFEEIIGYDVMIYGSSYYLNNAWELGDYPIWLAHYTEKTDYENDYIMWQLTNTGRINGIYGNVDVDIYYKK